LSYDPNRRLPSGWHISEGTDHKYRVIVC